MDTFVKIFYASGLGGEQRLEDDINRFAIKRKLDIVSAKPCFRKGVLEDTMFIVVVFKRKIEDNAIKEEDNAIKETDIEEIKLVVKESVPREWYLGKTDDQISTVGVKIRLGGELIGHYIEFNKPTLEVSDVVDAANTIFGELIESLKEGVEKC